LNFYKDYKKRIDFWKKKSPHVLDALLKLEIILDINSDFRDKAVSLETKENINNILKNGNFLTNSGIANIDFNFFKEVFFKILESLSPKLSYKDIDELPELINTYLNFIKLENDQPLNFEIDDIFSIVHLALKPQMEKTSISIPQPIETEEHIYNLCPVCGSLPYISDLRNENRSRHLHCSLCGAQWMFPRMRCVFCNNTDFEKLGYFTMDNEPDIRVDFCKICSCYIKNLDCSQFFEIPPMPVEDTGTLHFDFKALENGFIKPTPNFIGFIFLQNKDK